MKVSIDEEVLQNLLFRINQLEMVVYGGFDIQKAQQKIKPRTSTEDNDTKALKWLLGKERGYFFTVNDLNKGCRAVVNANHARRLIKKWEDIGDIKKSGNGWMTL